MKKIKLFQKKVIIPIIIVIVIIVAIVLGLYFYKKNNVKEVPVYSLEYIGMTDYWQDSNQTEGFVKADKIQSVYLSETQAIEKVLVKEGDTVKKGTPILKYSTTLSALELERKKIEISKMELNLDNATKDLEQVKTYQPNVPIYGDLGNFTSPEPDTSEEENNYIEFSEPLPKVSKDKEMVPAPLTGSGTNDLPYIFLWKDEKEYDKTFIEQLIKRAGREKTEVYAIFMIRDKNEVHGEFKSATKIKFSKKVDDYSFTIIKNYTVDEDPILEVKDETEDVPENTEISDIFAGIGPSYSAEELKKMILEKEKHISETILDIKIAKSEYAKLEEEIKDTTVYSKIDGVVKTVLDPTSSEAKTNPIIVISGGGGYYITGYIGELSLDTISVGQKVQTFSYTTGSMAEGEIKEISDIPLTGYSMFGMGNSNVSYYPYTVFVSDEANFREGDYVQIKLENNPAQTSTSSLYLSKAFILQESGKYFVYVENKDHKLEKRQIFIDGSAYTYLKIKSGITASDKLAFPYGKTVKEGATTVDGSVEDLYY